MPYLCIDRHNHKYYKPINPYCKGVRGNWGNVFLIGEGTLLGEIVLHATALSLRSNATVLGSALLTLALPSAGVFEGLLSKDISRRSCALTNGNILQLGVADACRLIVVRRAGEAEKSSSACGFAHGRWNFFLSPFGMRKFHIISTEFELSLFP